MLVTQPVPRRFRGNALALLLAALSAGVTVSAQTPSRATERLGGWSGSAGYETFALRDISRNQRPPDASPIKWRGAGSVVTICYDGTKPDAAGAHLAMLTASRAGRFSYVSPVRGFAADSDDSASHWDLRYEYRRYLWRDIGGFGLDVGAGAQAVAAKVAFERHLGVHATSSRTLGGGFAGVAVIRWNGWRRLQVEGSWANGAVVSRRRTDHDAAPLASDSFGGGSWIGDLVVEGRWQLTPGVRLSATWQRSYEGYQSSHFAFAGNRQAFVAGVAYAR